MFRVRIGRFDRQESDTVIDWIIRSVHLFVLAVVVFMIWAIFISLETFEAYASIVASVSFGTTWLVTSFIIWFTVLFRFGIFKGYAPWSCVRWDHPFFYVLIAISFPGFIVNALMLLLIYMSVGLVLSLRECGWQTLGSGIQRWWRNNVDIPVCTREAHERVTRMQQALLILTQQQQEYVKSSIGCTYDEIDTIIKTAQLHREASLDSFLEMGDKILQQRLNKAQDCVKIAAAGLEEAQRNAANARMELIKVQRAQHDRDHSLFNKHTLERAEQHPCVRVIEVNSQTVRIFLSTIFIRAGKKIYEIGDFVLTWVPAEIDMFYVECCRTTNPLRCHPYGNAVLTPGSRWVSANICFGDAHDELRSFLQKGDLYSLIDLAHEMMIRPGTEMEGWREVPKS